MYISKLKIENYRNFRNFQIELKPLTLIIGENNIGKSNLLDAIGLIFSQDVSFFRKRTLDVADINHECIIELKKAILDSAIPAEKIAYPVIQVTATLTDFDTDQASVVGDWFSNKDFSEAQLTYSFGPTSKLDQAAEILGQRKFINKYKDEVGEEAFNSLPERSKLDLVNFPISKYYYSIYGGTQKESQANSYHLNQLKFELLDALRDARKELVSSQRTSLLFKVLNSKDETEYQDLKTQLVGLQDAIDQNAALQNVKSGIAEQLEKISLKTETDSNLVDFLFSLPNISDLLKKLSLIYGEKPIQIERNGMGRNNLLLISLMLSYIEGAGNAQMTYFRVVAIEEPESHLHPNLQNNLALNIEKLIKRDGEKEIRKDIQLLLTSHSTHIITKLDFDNTVVIYMQNNFPTAHYILQGFDEKAKDLKHIKYLKKYFDAVNANMFYSQRVMLVEGISEKLLLPVFYEMYTNNSIEQTNSCIINVNGLAFQNFLEIIKNGYFQKCLVFTDRDKGTKAEDRAENLAKDYASTPYINVAISDESTFEKDLIKENKSGQGAVILCRILKMVRPIAGKNYVEQLGDSDIQIKEYFELIEHFKSDFAYLLMTELCENHEGFTIPNYITKGFDFMKN